MLIFAALLYATLAIFIPAPAFAHVKWFLDESESEILNQPKPDLFSHPNLENTSIILIGLASLYVCILLGQRFRKATFNGKLLKLASTLEPAINLVVGVTTGIMLIHCALNHVYLAPNMVAPPQIRYFVSTLQFASGTGLILGICTRFWSMCLISLFIFSFAFFPMSDCLDLIPLYGVALYLFLRGRQPAGLDRFLNIPAINSPVLQNLAHNALRWGLGLGLVVLAFDEKLVHPQLALHLLSDVPDLNFLQALGVDNASFVFCAGVVEVVLGLLILSGCLPRLATLLLAGFFTITTLKFGSCELIGHMPFYGIILSILLRGSGEPQEERHPASDGTPAAVAILPAALSSTTVRKTRQKSA